VVYGTRCNVMPSQELVPWQIGHLSNGRLFNSFFPPIFSPAHLSIPFTITNWTIGPYAGSAFQIFEAAMQCHTRTLSLEVCTFSSMPWRY
jgi:hypothetical protein